MLRCAQAKPQSGTGHRHGRNLHRQRARARRSDSGRRQRRHSPPPRPQRATWPVMARRRRPRRRSQPQAAATGPAWELAPGRSRLRALRPRRPASPAAPNPAHAHRRHSTPRRVRKASPPQHPGGGTPCIVGTCSGELAPGAVRVPAGPSTAAWSSVAFIVRPFPASVGPSVSRPPLSASGANAWCPAG